jgi:hypothetical protein
MPQILASVYADTVGVGRCRDEACGARITWAENVVTHRRMPFDGELVAIRTSTEPATGRQIWHVDLDQNHWRSCPGSDKFRRGRVKS